MNRRKALKNGLLGIGALVISPSLKSFSTLLNNTTLGVQLFTIPKMVDTDLKGSLQLISELGYQEVEFFGPHPFSVQSAKDSWNRIKPMLGITNNAFYGYTSWFFKRLQFKISIHAY